MLLLIILVQGIHYLIISTSPREPEFVLHEHPSVIRWLDSLQTAEANDRPYFRYNPNFLSDYQAYMLGIKPEEIDRIFAYRAEGNWIESETEFWAVSAIDPERREAIAFRLRFEKNKESRVSFVKKQTPDVKPVLRDINKATAQELMRVRGIGPVFSERIVKFRDRLGGFQVIEQLIDVYGLEKEVVERLFERYEVTEKPEIGLININEASAEDIASLIYLSRKVAYGIIRYREQHGPFENLEELTKIEDFPSDKISRISLYLSL